MTRYVLIGEVNVYVFLYADNAILMAENPKAGANFRPNI